MKKKLIYLVCTTALLSSCHIYKSYDRPDDIETAGMYRDPYAATDTFTSDTTNMGNLPWQEVFRDPQLQALIEHALENNTDFQAATLRVEQAQAMLLSTRLSYLPSLNLAPQGTLSSFDGGSVNKTYQLPAVASWEIDLFGRLLNSNRSAKASLLQSEAYRQAVRSQLIANVANTYYTLLMLDRQLAISEETARIWKENVRAMTAMKNAGMTNEAAVAQSRANSHQVEAALADLRRQIRETENALSVVLGEAPHSIARGVLERQVLPQDLNAGIPVQMLANRPDVRVAEMQLAVAYYATNQARSAFYPQLILNGSAGWTNSAGGMIVNPGKVLLSAVGSLTQPLFNKGANIARLKVSKAQQEEAALNFQQSILNAGKEVSDALYLYETASAKMVERRSQVEAMESAVNATKSLFTLGSSSYLETLTAQQGLLSAQLAEVSDTFQRMQAVVSLYRALGGGRE
ncbi:efflux transporter outer membrane subunit [Parabacteroides sp. PF5-9]|uniref:efflux transporter outer membrane subunit n=1 Tax=Parabacteroides sp. PF5-9 TaxID=1742404 RepID=UPI002476BB9B|nr:efflux transporter outer membrane subunit [Parabacteroides sp. PF5-9]MDH6358052.1 multidrug efflux system outer membrane protein [Parabacteroides sp. PF5-9]